MMKSIVIGSLLVLAMGSQVSFAIPGTHIEPDATESVGSPPVGDLSKKPTANPAPVADADVSDKPAHIRAKILIDPHKSE